MKTLYDAYISFKQTNSKETYCTDEGIEKEVGIHYVQVYQQRKGIFTRFIKQFLNNEEIIRIAVYGVESHKMINCLRKIIYNGIPFINHGGDFLWARDGNYCKCIHKDDFYEKQRRLFNYQYCLDEKCEEYLRFSLDHKCSYKRKVEKEIN